MGYWIFMTAVAFVIPLTMLLIGRAYEKKAPKKINSISGYRTAMSMKNRDTWEFAHRYFGSIWKKWSGWVLLGSAAAMLLCFGGTEDEVGLMGGLVYTVQTIVMCIPVIMTEKALKNTFDKYGLKKE